MSQSWVGRTIGDRYQIDSLLGQGGMSAVYRATDPNLRRMVAIKLIHTHLSVNPNFVNRFKEEAAAVARLRHPNIVQVHDFYSDGDTYFMVMEYLTGETLQARLKRLNAAQRYMPYQEVIRFGTQLCEAVGYAHNHELIHRDIKPANIMLDLDGQAILMDFGIVKIIGGEYHTATGATIGTAMYMSPEQIRSERVDECSDIYSMGVTLYEMISGRTPYQADSVMTLMMMVLNDPLPDLRENRQGIPESIAAVVEKALAKEVKDRFQSMDEMAAALQGVQERESSAASLVTVVDDEQLAQAPEPDPPIHSPEQIVDPASATEIEGSLPHEELAEAAREPDLHSGEQRIAAVPTEIDQPVEPTIAPQQAVPTKGGDTSRANYRRIILVAAVLLLIGVVIAGGLFYLQAQKPPSIQLTSVDQPPAQINAQTAQFVVNLAEWQIGSWIEELDYSPDGKLIGTANNWDLMGLFKHRFYGGLWRVDTGSLKNYLLGHTQWVYSVAFSPDGQLFATASDDDSVMLWNVSDAGLVRTIEASMGGVTSVDFSPNNLLLAAGSWGGDVGMWQVSDGHLLRTLQGHEDSVMDVEFSPDGKLLASASDDHTIRVWQVGDGSLVQTMRGHTAPIYELAFSPDGTWLASASGDYSIGVWQVSDGTLVRSLQGHSDSVFDVAFSPDGSLLASGSGDETLRLWRVADGEMLRILTEHSDVITSVAFSPDGHMLVSGASDGAVHFWGLSEAIPLEAEVQE